MAEPNRSSTAAAHGNEPLGRSNIPERADVNRLLSVGALYRALSGQHTYPDDVPDPDELEHVLERTPTGFSRNAAAVEALLRSDGIDAVRAAVRYAGQAHV